MTDGGASPDSLVSMPDGTIAAEDGQVIGQDAGLALDSSVTPFLSISPPSVNLSDVVFFTQAPLQRVTVTNTGNGDSGLMAIVVTGADQGDFVVSNDGCSGRSVIVSGSCTFDVTNNINTPEHLHSATISMSANPGVIIDVPIRANIISVMNVRPASQVYPATAAGDRSAAQRFTFTYTGTTRTDTVTAVLGGITPGEFIKFNDNCTGFSMQPGTTCTVDAFFSPASPGNKAAYLTVTAKPGGSASAMLSGTAL